MTIVLGTLKKTFNEIALLVKHGVKSMFHFEINIVRNTNFRTMFFKIIADFIGKVSPLSEYFLTCKRNAGK